MPKIIVLLFSIFFLIAMPTQSFALTEEEISKQLKCQCGCGFPDLASCSCDEWAQPAKAEIRARIARGEDLATILKYFVDRHTETVLTSPVKEGFNHAAWIIPGVLFFLGLGFVGVVLSKWKARKNPGAGDGTPKKEVAQSQVSEADQKYISEIDKELYGS